MTLAGALNRKIVRSKVSILEFSEAPWGPKITLSPAQRFAVKLVYQLPLDSEVRDIKIYDKFKENTLYTFSETEYRHYLYSEGRLNMPFDDSHEDARFDTYLRAFGRRAGKSEITALDVAYAIYTLLELKNPQEYYGIPDGTEIYIPVLGTSQESAKKTFRKVRNMLAQSGYFKVYCEDDDLQELFCKIYTPQQREVNAKFPSIIVQAFPLSDAQVRGPAAYRAVCDEVAHWPHHGQLNDAEVIKAIQPSLSTFKTAENQPTEGKIFLISNAGVCDGYFYNQFTKAIQDEDQTSVIAFQAPSFEMNPKRLGPQELRNYYNQNGDVAYRTEYLSEFVEAMSQWLTEEEMNCMFDRSRESLSVRPQDPSRAYVFYQKHAYPQYFWGFDLGLKNDAAGLAICHWEKNDLTGERKLVFDYVERRKAGEGVYAHLAELSGDEVIEWLYQMAQSFPITDGIFDQWSGLMFGQALTKRGVKGLRMVTFTRPLNSQIYLTFRSLSLNHEISLPTGLNPELEKEIRLLQCELLPGNAISVEAPAGPQYHDDMSDAIARSCHVAVQFLADQPADSKKLKSNCVTLVRSASSGGVKDVSSLAQQARAGHARSMYKLRTRR
jgi:hypothetical protein